MKRTYSYNKLLLVLVAVALSGCVLVPDGGYDHNRGYDRGDHRMDREGRHPQQDQDRREGDRRGN